MVSISLSQNLTTDINTSNTPESLEVKQLVEWAIRAGQYFPIFIWPCITSPLFCFLYPLTLEELKVPCNRLWKVMPWQRFLGRTGIWGSTGLHRNTNEEMQRTNWWLTNPSPSLRLASNLVIQALKWAARQARWKRRDGNICFIFFTDLKLRPLQKIRVGLQPFCSRSAPLCCRLYPLWPAGGAVCYRFLRVRLCQPFQQCPLLLHQSFRIL